MNLEPIPKMTLSLASALRAYGSGAAANIARLGQVFEPGDLYGDQAAGLAEDLLASAAQMNGLAADLRVAAGRLVTRAKEVDSSAPVVTQLGGSSGTRTFLINRSAGRLEVFLEVLGTRLDDELTRLGSETVAGALGRIETESPWRRKDRPSWVEWIARSPVLRETAFTRAIISSRKLAIPRATAERTIVGELRSLGRSRGVAPTYLRRSERIVAVKGSPANVSPFIRGPRLDLIGSDETGLTFRETLSQARFARGDILVVNAAAFELTS
jgi:hypothetical protein